MSPLAIELQNPIYDSLSDTEAAELISSKKITIRTLVPTWKIKQHSIENGYYAKIALASIDTTIPIEVRALAISVLAWVNDPAIQTCDLDLATVKIMVNGLVNSGMMTEEMASELSSLADTPISWGESVGIKEIIGPGLVYNARMEIIREREEP